MIMCEVCEGKAPILTKSSMKKDSMDCYVARMHEGRLYFFITIESAMNVTNMSIGFDCDFCPKCGERLNKG